MPLACSVKSITVLSFLSIIVSVIWLLLKQFTGCFPFTILLDIISFSSQIRTWKPREAEEAPGGHCTSKRQSWCSEPRSGRRWCALHCPPLCPGNSSVTAGHTISRSPCYCLFSQDLVWHYPWQSCPYDFHLADGQAEGFGCGAPGWGWETQPQARHENTDSSRPQARWAVCTPPGTEPGRALRTSVSVNPISSDTAQRSNRSDSCAWPVCPLPQKQGVRQEARCSLRHPLPQTQVTGREGPGPSASRAAARPTRAPPRAAPHACRDRRAAPSRQLAAANAHRRRRHLSPGRVNRVAPGSVSEPPDGVGSPPVLWPLLRVLSGHLKFGGSACWCIEPVLAVKSSWGQGRFSEELEIKTESKTQRNEGSKPKRVKGKGAQKDSETDAP